MPYYICERTHQSLKRVIIYQHIIDELEIFSDTCILSDPSMLSPNCKVTAFLVCNRITKTCSLGSEARALPCQLLLRGIRLYPLGSIYPTNLFDVRVTFDDDLEFNNKRPCKLQVPIQRAAGRGVFGQGRNDACSEPEYRCTQVGNCHRLI